MRVFADSSAVVKLYADEEHSDVVRRFDSLVTSSICRVEVVAALWRKTRIGEISSSAASMLVREFEFDLADTPDGVVRYVPMPVTDSLLSKASQLLPFHELRSLDAVQLASALYARELDPECAGFVCFDQRLTRAATAHGFRVISSS